MDLNLKISEALGLITNIQHPYKLCDFKPAYGVIFNDLIKDFDFWGFTDIDVIFGDIRTFITDQLLGQYDLISVRPDWIPGCFLLFKNELKMNYLYKNSKDFQLVFSSPEHFCFDETNFAHTQFSQGLPYYEIKTKIESMMHVVMRLYSQGKINPYFDIHIVEGIPGRLMWENGRMYYRRSFEILLYHLIRLKKSYNPKPKRIREINSFFISQRRIY